MSIRWFGALDGERLKQVKDVLNRIRSTCGAVGFISHVEEMKQAIFDRIEATTMGECWCQHTQV